MNTRRVIIVSFAVLVLIFAAFIFKLVTDDRRIWTDEKEAHAAITKLYGRYKEGTDFRVMELSDGQNFTIPQNLLGKLSIGDSVFKEKGQHFYRFKSMKKE